LNLTILLHLFTFRALDNRLFLLLYLDNRREFRVIFVELLDNFLLLRHVDYISHGHLFQLLIVLFGVSLARHGVLISLIRYHLILIVHQFLYTLDGGATEACELKYIGIIGVNGKTSARINDFRLFERTCLQVIGWREVQVETQAVNYFLLFLLFSTLRQSVSLINIPKVMIIRSGIVFILKQQTFNIGGPESMRLELLCESSCSRTHSHQFVKVDLILF
jgi:hypothetical protein